MWRGVQGRLQEEYDRCTQLSLDPSSTRKPLLAVVEKELLAHHASAIVEKVRGPNEHRGWGIPLLPARGRPCQCILPALVHGLRSGRGSYHPHCL